MSIPIGSIDIPPSRVVNQASALFEPGVRRSILDLGCGIGRNALYLAAQGHDVLAVDSDAAALAEAEEAAIRRQLARRCHFVEADIRAYDPGAKFDVVTMNEVLHLMTRPQARNMLQRAQSVVKQGGLSVVSGYLVNDKIANVTNREHCLHPDELQVAYSDGWQVITYHEDEPRVRMHGNRQRVDSVAAIIAMRNW